MGLQRFLWLQGYLLATIGYGFSMMVVALLRLIDGMGVTLL
jgi:hypothetical protein